MWVDLDTLIKSVKLVGTSSGPKGKKCVKKKKNKKKIAKLLSINGTAVAHIKLD